MAISKITQICIADHCERQATCKGLCPRHYERKRRWGNENAPHKFRTTCTIEGCTSKHKSQGLCGMHYTRLLTRGDASYESGRNYAVGDTAEERLWSLVDKRGEDDCWEWQGAKNHQGYGQLQFQHQKHMTHRLAWECANQKMAVLFILHSCDNPPCCNPKHLREGTQQDNANDASERGRMGQGQQKRPDVIDIDTVRRARILFAQGFSRKQVMFIEDITYRSARDVDTARSFQWVE